MATDKETKMYNTAIARVAKLEEELEEAKTKRQVETKEDQLTNALKRLEVLEAKYNTPPETKKKVEEEEEEEEDDQCPVCGHSLSELGEGAYHCAGCNEYFEEE